MVKKYYVEFDLGRVGYEVNAKDERQAQEKANKKRVEDGFVSPNSECIEVRVL